MTADEARACLKELDELADRVSVLEKPSWPR